MFPITAYKKTRSGERIKVILTEESLYTYEYATNFELDRNEFHRLLSLLRDSESISSNIRTISFHGYAFSVTEDIEVPSAMDVIPSGLIYLSAKRLFIRPSGENYPYTGRTQQLTKTCNNCLEQSPRDSSFCIYCGEKIAN